MINPQSLFNEVQRREYKKRRVRALKQGRTYTALDFAQDQLVHIGRLMGELGDHPALVGSQRRAAILYVYEALRAAGLSVTLHGLKALMRQLENGGIAAPKRVSENP